MSCLAKFSRDGALLWATGIGGPGSDRGEDVLAGNRGDIYVTGSFQNAVDFNPGEGQVFLGSAGSDDVFVGRYATTGAFYAARAIGGAQEDIGWALARDAENNVIVGGSFQGSVDFDPSAATDVRNAVGGRDGFVTKLARDETPIGPAVAFLPLLSASTAAASTAR